MDVRSEPTVPRVTAALIVAGLWLRIGFAAAFAALSSPLLVARDALRAGDGAALFVLAAAIAWVAWRRTRALLGDETPVASRPVRSARDRHAPA